MNIRKALPGDLPEILRVYEAARAYMRASGNPDQWGYDYPPEDMLENDIKIGQLYIGEDESGKIRLSFALIPGNDPTYNYIEGAWLNDEPYAAIHRVASDGEKKGAFAACANFCAQNHKNLRIDTHEANLTMQHVMEKFGFVKCGRIYLENGDPRIAYQLPR